MRLPGSKIPAARRRDAQFFLVAERGILEAQASLLCESLRAFGGAYSQSPVTVVSPRPKLRPSRATIRKLARLNVEYLPLDLESPCPGYGTSFRILAAAYLEQHSRSEVLVQLDSDAIFAGEPDFELSAADAAARPVDVKGMCTEGDGDPFDPYWRTLCRLAGVEYENIPWITTTVDKRVVRANFNGGLVAVRRQIGLFRKTEQFFQLLVAADHRPWLNSGTLMKSGTGMVDREGTDFWGTSQAAFSLAVCALGAVIKILPSSYNIPLHSFALLPPAEAHPIHLHYHWLCSEGEMDTNPICDGRLQLSSRIREWIESKLPLRIPELTPFEKFMRNVF